MRHDIEGSTKMEINSRHWFDCPATRTPHDDTMTATAASSAKQVGSVMEKLCPRGRAFLRIPARRAAGAAQCRVNVGCPHPANTVVSRMEYDNHLKWADAFCRIARAG
jgi:hypothetical protein